MSAQTEAQRLAKELLFLPHTADWRICVQSATELMRLQTANAELLEALKMNAQALAWLAFGECRGFTDDLPTALESTDAARAAITKHGGKA